jgi:peptidylprolyl isomerase
VSSRERAARRRRAEARAVADADRRRRWWLRVGAVSVIAALIAGTGIVLAALGTGGGSEGTGSAPTTATRPRDVSVAGRPCVPVAEPLPAGAPEVPVETGPPPSGLVVRDLEPGDGPEVTAGATVTVDYIGVACSTGAIFDASYGRGQPATFPLDGVIAGWRDGLVGMKVGGTRLLGVPPDAAYGEQGFPPDIRPGETLWFVVQLRSVTPRPSGTAPGS